MQRLLAENIPRFIDRQMNQTVEQQPLKSADINLTNFQLKHPIYDDFGNKPRDENSSVEVNMSVYVCMYSNAGILLAQKINMDSGLRVIV